VKRILKFIIKIIWKFVLINVIRDVRVNFTCGEKRKGKTEYYLGLAIVVKSY